MANNPFHFVQSSSLFLKTCSALDGLKLIGSLETLYRQNDFNNPTPSLLLPPCQPRYHRSNSLIWIRWNHCYVRGCCPLLRALAWLYLGCRGRLETGRTPFIENLSSSYVQQKRMNHWNEDPSLMVRNGSSTPAVVQPHTFEVHKSNHSCVIKKRKSPSPNNDSRL